MALSRSLHAAAAGKRLRLLAPPLALALAIASLCVPAPARAIEAVPLGAFVDPVHVAVAPGAPRLLFVVEQAGRILVMRDEQKLSRPFLDIRDIVRGLPDGGAGPEQGLLSVAFPPDYETTRLFYVVFTNNDRDVEINEFQRSATIASRADPTTRRIVLIIRHRQAQKHNGGQLQFGPGGFLYISVGDGGEDSPRGEPARKLGNLLGKILRIDPRQTEDRPYGIPKGNPFRGKPGRDEIFAYGLRNPWRFFFDGTRMAIGDVGQSRREEINILDFRDVKGANFGWPQYEGELIFDANRPGPHEPTFPIHTYPRTPAGAAVIAGPFVHDPDLPTLFGRYIYGDSRTGDVRTFVANIEDQQAIDDSATGIVIEGLTSFGLGFGGKIYLAQRGSPGQVFRLAPSPP